MIDYFNDFIKEEIPKTLSIFWNFIISLGGGFIPYVLYFFIIKDIPGAPKITLIGGAVLAFSFSVILFLMVFHIRIKRFQINMKIKEKDNEINELNNSIKNLKEQVLLPIYLKLEDIKPYIIEETKLYKKYILNKVNFCFDVYSELSFVVKAGNKDIQFIEIRYNSGYCVYNSDIFKNMNIFLKEEQSNGYKLKLNRFSSTESEHIVRIELEDKKLKKGEKIEYTIIFKYDNYQFISEEELKYWHSKRQYPGENEISTTRIGDLGQKKMEITIEFPNDYEFYYPSFSVFTKSNIHVEPENERLKNNFNITQTRYAKLISFTIIEPIFGLSYSVNWRPPSLNSLRNINYLNETEIKLIQSKLNRYE